jgi:DNA polymerase I-like protein with 3'-5' exonuclease and polymerase domains
MMAAAVVEARGVPLDVETLTALRAAWPALKGEVLRAANATYGFWDEALRFKLARFEAWLADRGHAWPRTRTGRPALDEDVLHSMTRAIPALHEFREVRHAVNRLRLERLAVDPDGRNRVLLSAFRTTTGRNAPKASQFICGPARWLRHLIVAPPGRVLAYVDWSAQEHGVMAALSNDPGLLDDYQHGDPYLRMAARFGHAPPDATKATHGEIRERFKVVVLATSYGMGAATLATRLQVPRATAQALLDAHRSLYRVFWSWSDGVVDLGRLRHRLATPFGWRLAVRPHESDRTLRNWPVQATAADMMRLALVRVIEAGIGRGRRDP